MKSANSFTVIESTKGNIWLVGTASEHHVLYQYNLVNTQNIFAGQVQTETPYFQPTPAVPNPFSIQASLNDPTFPSGVKSAYGLRIKNSKHIFGYGVGLYSFFSSWSTGKFLPLSPCVTGGIAKTSKLTRTYSLRYYRGRSYLPTSDCLRRVFFRYCHLQSQHCRRRQHDQPRWHLQGLIQGQCQRLYLHHCSFPTCLVEKIDNLEACIRKRRGLVICHGMERKQYILLFVAFWYP